MVRRNGTGKRVPTLREARQLGEDGLAQAEQAARAEWLDQAIHMVFTACLAHQTLICDDVWAMGLQSCGHDRAFGRAMKRALDNGWMRPSGHGRPSRRSHGSLKPEYVSLIYGQSETRQAVAS